METQRKRHHSELGEEETLPEKRSKFSVSNFCEGLKGGHWLPVLNEFVQLSKGPGEEKIDVAAQLLENGGGANDILRLLTAGKITLPNQYALAFEALQAIIIRTVTAVPSKLSETEEACHQVLRSHLHAIHSMLTENSIARQKKAVLGLLTAMVSLSASLAREVLSHVSFSPAVVEVLTQHSNPSDVKSVRTCFIYFLLAFLVDGDRATIQRLLGKKGLLSSIVLGLKQDRAELVVLVLTTLRTKVVENGSISKTSKLHLFNTQVIHALLELYSWKGPALFNSRAKGRRTKASFSQDTVDPENEALVAEAVHNLLLVLCSSYKYGVAFHDKSLGSSGQRHNQLVLTVLQHIEQPWEKKWTADLVVQTLRGCPDLLRSMASSWRPFLEPRDSERWFQAVGLVRKVLSSLNPEEYLKPCLDNLSAAQLLSTVQALTVPAAVLSPVGTCGLEHQHAQVRQEVVSLLVSMLTQLQKTIAVIETWGHLDPAGSQKLNCGINSYLKQHLPKGDAVYAAWQNEFSPATEEQDVAPSSDRLNLLLDLLLLYLKCCPSILTHLDFSCFLEQVRMVHKKDASMMVKVFQLMLQTNGSVLSPKKEQFGEAIFQLFCLSRHSSPSVSVPAEQTLEVILRCSGLFQSSRDEVSVWLHCYRAITAESSGEVAQFLTCVLTSAARDLFRYSDITVEAAKENDVPCLHKNRMDQIFNVIFDVNQNLEETELDASTFLELSPILACAVEVAETKPGDETIRYLSSVIVHLLHFQPRPDQLIKVASHWSHLPPPVAKYLRGWKRHNKPVPLKKPFGSHSPEGRLSRALLASEDCHIEFPKEDPIHSLLLFKLVLFHVTQLANCSQLSREVCETAKKIFRQLVNAVVPVRGPKNFSLNCLKSVLSHATILHFFNPLATEEQVTERLITELAVELIKMTSRSLGNHNCHFRSLIPLQRKLMSSIHGVASHSGEALRGSELILSAVQVLRLQTSQISEILHLLAPLPTVPGSGCDLLLVDLLRKTEEPLAGDAVAALVQHLIELKEAESDLALSVKEYLVRFPHSMAHVSEDQFKALLPVGGPVPVLLLERNAALVPLLTTRLSKLKRLMLKPHLFIPLLSAALLHGENPTLLQAASEHYSDLIKKTICNSHKMPGWMKEHSETVKFLISNCWDEDVCRQICERVLKKHVTFDRLDSHCLGLIESVFKCCSAEGLELVLMDQLTKCLEAEGDPSDLCQYIEECLESCTTVRESKEWSKLHTLMLRSGLARNGHPLLLTVLAKILRRMSSDTNFMYEMVLSHSEFLNVMLGSDTAAKRGLVELLLALVKNNSSLLQMKHIPVILGAYGATLSSTDQLLLQLLHIAETSCAASFHQYRPYLWGEAAVSHYSVRLGEGLALWRVPNTNQVLELLEPSIVAATIKSFPADRQLQVLDTTLPGRPDVYDPAFLLPLFSHLLAPESVVYTHKVNHSGALALTISALASNCPLMRAAAGHVMERYQDQMEAGRSGKEERLLLQFLSALRGGIANLKEEESTVIPQLPGVTTTFLARASLIMAQPLDPLYVPLHDYVQAKPALNLTVVPEFLVLLRNSSVHYKLYCTWILEVLRDGLQNKQDVRVCFRSSVFTIIMVMFGCCITDYHTKILVLQVVESAMKVPSLASQLVLERSLLTSLYTEVQELSSPMGVEVASAILAILKYALCHTNGLHDYFLTWLLDELWPRLPDSLSETDLCIFLKCALSCKFIDNLVPGELLKIIDLAKRVLGTVEDCEQLVQFGSQFAAVERRKEETASALLRKLTLTWLQKQSQPPDN